MPGCKFIINILRDNTIFSKIKTTHNLLTLSRCGENCCKLCHRGQWRGPASAFLRKEGKHKKKLLYPHSIIVQFCAFPKNYGNAFKCRHFCRTFRSKYLILFLPFICDFESEFFRIFLLNFKLKQLIYKQKGIQDDESNRVSQQFRFLWIRENRKTLFTWKAETYLHFSFCEYKWKFIFSSNKIK